MKEAYETNNVCPLCLTELNVMVAAHNGPGAPEAGEFTICGHCGTVLRIGENLSVRRLTVKDIEDLGERPRTLCCILNIQDRIKKRQQLG
jgi:hypothetical protein